MSVPTIFLFGGGGYIGTHLRRKLSPKRQVIVIEKDKEFSSHKCKYDKDNAWFIHLACPHKGDYVDNPGQFIVDAGMALEHGIWWKEALGIPNSRALYFSSASVYDESVGYYSIFKGGAEIRVARQFDHIIRPGTVFGWDYCDMVRRSYYHRTDTVVNKLIHRIAEGDEDVWVDDTERYVSHISDITQAVATWIKTGSVPEQGTYSVPVQLSELFYLVDIENKEQRTVDAFVQNWEHYDDIKVQMWRMAIKGMVELYREDPRRLQCLGK